jgi:ribosomal protein L11 methyltransferase
MVTMNEKSWQKLLINCPTALEEAIASVVTELTGSGVEIIDDATSPDNSLVIGYLAAADPALTDKLAAIRAYLRELARQFPGYRESALELETLADQDWHRLWKESFKPFHLSKTVVVKPSWADYTPAPADKVIEIDPGMAFGTGLHASTRLAMELLEKRVGKMAPPPGKTLDVGTGTGILAIGAALFGCGRITAIDNDPEAVIAAQNNITANNLSDIIAVSDTDLEELAGPYDLILANIIHNTLVEMAPALTELLAVNGTLILAGILKGEQSENIARIYGKHGLTRQAELSSGEWSALSLTNSQKVMLNP